ncbi:MAG: DNA-binding IscR family transcriptional regulator [Celeribacter sp.]|jgi:DNA-binding IscR family transcriptional regulator
MVTNTRFAVAIHILVVIAAQEGKPVPSEVIADSVNSHSSVVRRILMLLNKKKITDARLGVGGGAILSKPASKITLLDIHDAVGVTELFSFHRSGPNTECMVGRSILPVINKRLEPTISAFRRELAAVTLDEITSDVLERGKVAGGLFRHL